MSIKPDGGPAFPVLFRDSKGGWLAVGGMSLRDYAVIHFAAAMLANPNLEGSAVEIVAGAGRYADAMLAEREEG